MCSECIDDYTEAFLSRNCIKTSDCSSHWLLYVIPVSYALFMILICVATIYGATDKFVKAYSAGTSIVNVVTSGQHRLSSNSRPSRAQPSNSDSLLDSDGEALGHDGSHGPEIHTDENSSTCMTKIQLRQCLTFLMIFVMMNQDFSNFHPTLLDCSEHWRLYPYILNKLTVSNTAHFSIDVIGTFYDNICIPGLSTLTKELIKTSIYFTPYVLFPFLYLIHIIWKQYRTTVPDQEPNQEAARSGEQIQYNEQTASVEVPVRTNSNNSKPDITFRLSAGFFTMQQLTFQKVSTVGIQFVNCYIIDNINILHMDATHICYSEHWQIGTWVYLAVCIIPLPVYIMIAPSLLRKEVIKLSHFNLGLVFPLFALLMSPLLCCKAILLRRLDNPSQSLSHSVLGSSDEDVFVAPNESEHLLPGRVDRQETAEPPNTRHVTAVVDLEPTPSRDEQLTVDNNQRINHESRHSRVLQPATEDQIDPMEDTNRNANEPRGAEASDDTSRTQRNNPDLNNLVDNTIEAPYRKILIEYFREHSVTWLGVVSLFRLSLVLCSLLTHSVWLCALVLNVISLVRLLLEWAVKPYGNNWLNYFSLVSLICIWIVSYFNLLLATMERMQFQDCATSLPIQICGYIFDAFTVYLSVLGAVIFISYFLLWAGIKTSNFICNLCHGLGKLVTVIRIIVRLENS